VPSPRPDLRRGRIVWVSLRDRRGYSKDRPAIILTPTHDITDEDDLELMAITTTYADPTPKDHVELPWRNSGHPVTRLKRRSAAVTTWLDFASPADVLELGGDVPPKLMLQILDSLGRERGV
jgi:hypothetical protein